MLARAPIDSCAGGAGLRGGWSSGGGSGGGRNGGGEGLGGGLGGSGSFLWVKSFVNGGFTEMEKRVSYEFGDQVGFDRLWQVLTDP